MKYLFSGVEIVYAEYGGRLIRFNMGCNPGLPRLDIRTLALKDLYPSTISSLPVR
jgi:hypothetical protein